MENFNGFPFSDFQNESNVLQIPYLSTYNESSLTQMMPTSPHLDYASGIRNFRSIGVSGHSMESLETNEDDENRKSEAKMARANRKVARQMRAMKKTNPTANWSICSPTSLCESSSKDTFSKSNISSVYDRRSFYTQDNVKLSLVLRKMLTCSDVKDQGRILLPKREAEENLPCLASKAGVEIVMREVFTNTEWKMKYRFWANQKGFIYLFDQCGDFVKKNLLEAGDHLELYQDEQHNLYYTIKRNKKYEARPSNTQGDTRIGYISMMTETTEEEDWSLRVLMEELKHEEDNLANTLTI